MTSERGSSSSIVGNGGSCPFCPILKPADVGVGGTCMNVGMVAVVRRLLTTGEAL